MKGSFAKRHISVFTYFPKLWGLFLESRGYQSNWCWCDMQEQHCALLRHINLFKQLLSIYKKQFCLSLHLPHALSTMSTMKYSRMLSDLAGMHTFMYLFPNKGKNAGAYSHPIIQLMHPIFGYIASKALFHLSSLHFPIQTTFSFPCPVSKLIFETVQWGLSKEPSSKMKG